MWIGLELTGTGLAERRRMEGSRRNDAFDGKGGRVCWGRVSERIVVRVLLMGMGNFCHEHFFLKIVRE